MKISVTCLRIKWLIIIVITIILRVALIRIYISLRILWIKIIWILLGLVLKITPRLIISLWLKLWLSLISSLLFYSRIVLIWLTTSVLGRLLIMIGFWIVRIVWKSLFSILILVLCHRLLTKIVISLKIIILEVILIWILFVFSLVNSFSKIILRIIGTILIPISVRSILPMMVLSPISVIWILPWLIPIHILRSSIFVEIRPWPHGARSVSMKKITLIAFFAISILCKEITRFVYFGHLRNY